MTDDDALGPCDCFTVLESRTQRVPQCEVCDHIAAEHGSSNERVLTGGEIETLRKRVLIKRYERRQKEHPRKPDPTSDVRTNGDPEIH